MDILQSVKEIFPRRGAKETIENQLNKSPLLRFRTPKLLGKMAMPVFVGGRASLQGANRKRGGEQSGDGQEKKNRGP